MCAGVNITSPIAPPNADNVHLKTRWRCVTDVLRLNYHLTSQFDTGIEYRWTTNLLTDEEEHGALFEIAWLPVEYASVGVGYNFTSFSDDLLTPSLSDHGFFLRVTGRY